MTKMIEFGNFEYVKSADWSTKPLTVQMILDAKAMLEANEPNAMDSVGGISSMYRKNEQRANVTPAQILDAAIAKTEEGGPARWFQHLPMGFQQQVCLGQRVAREMLNAGVLNIAQRIEFDRAFTEAATQVMGKNASIVYLNDHAKSFEDMLVKAKQMKSLL